MLGLMLVSMLSACKSKENSHVIWVLDASKLESIKFYDSPTFSGKPLMILNENGVFYKGNQLCGWCYICDTPEKQKNIKYLHREHFNMLLNNCPSDLPILTSWGDNGLGVACLYIRTDTQSNNVGEVNFKGQRLYYNLNNLPSAWKKIESLIR